MIELPFKNIRVCLHFSFFAAVALLMLCSESQYAIYGLYACLLHETGHLLVMRIFGQPVKKLIFYGAGIKIVHCESKLPFIKELTVLAAGCIVNFTLYAMSALNSEWQIFGLVNLMVGLFNILPLNCLDGGKIIVLCFYKFFSGGTAERLEKILRGVNIVTVPATAIIFYFAGMGNFTLYVTLIYLLFTAVIM